MEALALLSRWVDRYIHQDDDEPLEVYEARFNAALAQLQAGVDAAGVDVECELLTWLTMRMHRRRYECLVHKWAV